MTRDELQVKYEKESARTTRLIHLNPYTPRYTDYYVEWLEQQLCQPCKSCQMLQGQVEKLDTENRELKNRIVIMKNTNSDIILGIDPDLGI